MAYTDNLATILGDLNGLTEAEKMNIAQAIFAEQFSVPNIKNTHPTLQEVRSGSKIPILNAENDYCSFPFTDGDCSLPSCNISSDWSTFTWKIAQIGCEVVVCLEDFSNDFMAFFGTWKKYNEDDLESAVIQFIVERFQRKHLGAEVRVAYFGDSNSADPLISGIDGFITQYEARATTENKVEITENVKLTGEQVFDYMKEMYDLATAQAWFRPESAVWRIDRGDAIALAGHLNTLGDNATGTCACIDPAKVVNPRIYQWDNLSFMGIPIEPMPFVDAMMCIDELYTDVDGFTSRNKMVLTQRNNAILGYEVEESLNRFKIGYDDREDDIWIRGASLFGVGVPLDQFVYASYTEPSV